MAKECVTADSDSPHDVLHLHSLLLYSDLFMFLAHIEGLELTAGQSVVIHHTIKNKMVVVITVVPLVAGS